MIRKNGLTSLLFLATVLMLLFGSCDPGRKYEKEEEAQIQDYLHSNPTLAFELQPSGLYYLPVQVGTGIMPVTHDTAWIKYTAKFLDGTVLDTNVGKTDSLKRPVNEGWLIAGIDEGITLMNNGGKAILLIPSKLAYGPTGSDYGIIPGYTPLLFDIELVRVKTGPAK
jgi:FKBP-type peptidyl-prolyl cis-trans isomerase FkpA